MTAAVLVVFALAVVLGCAGDADDAMPGADPGPVHVHGLGVNPADGALFIATHTGLFRLGEGESKSVRVGDSYQDIMGFTVVGKDRFIGSGHPDPSQDLPPLLGLIESRDAGRSWTTISLSGEADFHVLRASGNRVYGYDASHDRLMSSSDAGLTWSEVERPVPLVDLAIDPTDSRRLVAAGASDLEQGLYASRDGGLSWTRIGDQVGLLAWPDPERLFLVDSAGRVFLSNGIDKSFVLRGAIGSESVAIIWLGAKILALASSGQVKQSEDGGVTWTERATS